MVVEQRDLYSRDRVDEDVEIDFPSMAQRRIEIRPVGRRSGASSGDQVVVKALEAWVREDELPDPVFAPIDRGNPYPPTFLEMLAASTPDAVVLDCGGGDRQVGDGRLFNLEYLPYTAPDLYADGLHLPFRNDGLEHKWPAEQRAALSELLRRFDDSLSYDELRYFASAVAVTARKS